MDLVIAGDADGRDRALQLQTDAGGRMVVHEVAIVGAGLAGAVLALVLGRAGTDVVVIDPAAAHPADFRCEKLLADQAALMRELGIAEVVARGLGLDAAALTGRGFRYDALVNALRAAWPSSVRFVQDRVSRIGTTPGHQRLELAGGEVVEARLAVLATGSAARLLRELGLERRTVRARHSVCIGFTLRRRDGGAFPFAGRAHPGERAGDRVAFASLFPWTGEDGRGGMRVNLFTYHDPRGPTVRALRADPLGELLALAPGLRGALDGCEVTGPAVVRSTDLYVPAGEPGPGLALVGDAHASSCPATGLGVTRALTEARQLARVHLPTWLASPGMGADKTSAFHRDPVRLALDAHTLRRAETGRSGAVETSAYWRARRAAKALRRRLAPRPPARARRSEGASALARGQWVRVRDAASIAATLDAQGRLDGLPFMPEMAALCGRTLRVRRLADRTCVEGHGLRRLDAAVFLEGARCDGSAHDGCQRDCLMFWKTAWLERVDGPDAGGDGATAAAAPEALGWAGALPTREGEVYLCQSTALAAATRPPPRRDGAQLLRELARGDLPLAGFLAMSWRAAANRVLRRLGRAELGMIRGVCDKPSRGDLGLAPGEPVRIKRPAALKQALSPDSRNRGLTFEPEMAMRAGEDHRIAFPVERMIHEETGRMVTLKRTVVLQDVYCRGACARNCPRSNPLFWRESWLERRGGA